jgi:hypothetical protein
MIFIALVAVAVWLADLRLAVALLLVALAWVIAATIEYLAWRSARGPVAFVEAGTVAAPAVPPPVLSPDPEPAAEVEPEPVPKPPSVEQTIVAPPAPPVELEPEAVVEQEPEPELEPEPEPEPEPELAETLPATPEPEPPDAEPQQSRWGMRKRLRAVPTPPPEPVPVLDAASEAVEQRVVPLPQRSYTPRQWNLWDLERLVRATAREHPERRDEWAFLFVHLRQFANPDGVLPAEFDSLVRESFGEVLERQPSR